jgi:hypothetical protein
MSCSALILTLSSHSRSFCLSPFVSTVRKRHHAVLGERLALLIVVHGMDVDAHPNSQWIFELTL